MSSKNNPENRGKVTELRTWKGKKVKPVLFIKRGSGKFMAAMYEDGTLVDAGNGLPLAYKNANAA